MNKNENGFSLVIIVIFMSIAALFIGYLMGSWLISFLVEEDAPEIAEQKQNTPEVEQQVSETPEDVEEVNNSENNLTAPTEEERQIAPDQNNQNQTETTANNNQNQSEETATGNNNDSTSRDIAGSFGVQIGAFSNYNNAVTLQDKIEAMGYEVVVTDSSPHQVQVVGYNSREEAESAAAELENEGYNGFIVIRE